MFLYLQAKNILLESLENSQTFSPKYSSYIYFQVSNTLSEVCGVIKHAQEGK